jgi:hypothetical protein
MSIRRSPIVRNVTRHSGWYRRLLFKDLCEIQVMQLPVLTDVFVVSLEIFHECVLLYRYKFTTHTSFPFEGVREQTLMGA